MLYEGKEHHGYWWLHFNSQLVKADNLNHRVDPENFFKHVPCVKWWKVTCQFEFYKMMKEYGELKESVPLAIA